MIYAHLSPSPPSPAPTQAQRLHAHADAVEHAAALGGWVDATGTRHALSEADRAQWARDAAVLREAAHRAGSAP